jgi:hypothetical protein
MRRHYTKSLGMQRLPGPTGEAGWMRKPAEDLTSIIPPPAYSDDPFPDEA